MWTTYVIYNWEFGKIYIGQTHDIERRLIEHNKKRGNHFTANIKGNWTLIYSETYNTKTDALKREKQLKSYRGREFIKKIIQLKRSVPL